MSATADRPAVEAPSTEAPSALTRVEGLELLGEVSGSGYKDGAALVRRADGQMVQLGPLMYALLEAIDGERDPAALAAAMTERLGRQVDEEHVLALGQKLCEQGLLVGSEDNAPERMNPLLALRWKVLFTDPKVTKRITAPFEHLFRPWLLVPLLMGFAVVFWFVLIHKGVASATAQAFNSPELLLLIFGLGVASAGFHEIGHASACRYGGGRPGGMGAGIYVVWPAFYTDVTDAYRLPKRARLRTDLGGLYFNAVVAVVTLGVWLAVRADALLLVIALQMLEMVKQLSPVIRADGYHILSDATGVPDLYAHMGPTLKRLLPWTPKEPSALTGRTRFFVTAWVLVIVPVLISMSLSAILLLPKLGTTAYASGSHIIDALPDQGVFGILASILRLFALTLPVIGALLMAQRLGKTVVTKGAAWSGGRPERHGALALAGIARRVPARLGLVALRPVPAGARDRQRHAAGRGAHGRRARERGAPAAADRGADRRRAGHAEARQAPGRRPDPRGRRDQAAPRRLRHQGQQGREARRAGQRQDARPQERPDGAGGVRPAAARPPRPRRRRPRRRAPAPRPARRSTSRPSTSRCPTSRGPTTRRRWPSTTRTAASSTASPTRWSPSPAASPWTRATPPTRSPTATRARPSRSPSSSC